MNEQIYTFLTSDTHKKHLLYLIFKIQKFPFETKFNTDKKDKVGSFEKLYADSKALFRSMELQLVIRSLMLLI